jgi:hypothetical protein
VKVILGKHFAEGGKGAVDVAEEVVRLCEQPNNFKFVYEDSTPLWDKMKAIAQKIYHASDITADSKVRAHQAVAGEWLRALPGVRGQDAVFVLDGSEAAGAPSDHIVNIREVRLAAGAEFIVMICGDIMTMPGLPKVPAADSIDIDENGQGWSVSRAAASAWASKVSPTMLSSIAWSTALGISEAAWRRPPLPCGGAVACANTSTCQSSRAHDRPTPRVPVDSCRVKVRQ